MVLLSGEEYGVGYIIMYVYVEKRVMVRRGMRSLSMQLKYGGWAGG